MSRSALALYFDGPLQSWGVASQFQLRDTEAYPSKSAVVGIIAAALGIDKHAPGEAEELQPLATLTFSAFRLTGTVGRRAGRARITRLVDFHTIGGGYDRKNPVEALHIPKKASGGPFGTVITRRTYLNDAKFVAVLEGDATILKRVSMAVEDPVWGIWFGRKCCLPAVPLLPTLADSIPDAVGTLLRRIYPDVTDESLSSLTGHLQKDAGDLAYWNDQPLSFGTRTFQSRPVQRNAKL